MTTSYFIYSIPEEKKNGTTLLKYKNHYIVLYSL